MSIGIPEMLVLLVIVLIVFGAGKLPKVMGDLGKGLKAFKTGMSDTMGGRDTAPGPTESDTPASMTPQLTAPTERTPAPVSVQAAASRD